MTFPRGSSARPYPAQMRAPGRPAPNAGSDQRARFRGLPRVRPKRETGIVDDEMLQYAARSRTRRSIGARHASHRLDDPQVSYEEEQSTRRRRCFSRAIRRAWAIATPRVEDFLSSKFPTCSAESRRVRVRGAHPAPRRITRTSDRSRASSDQSSCCRTPAAPAAAPRTKASDTGFVQSMNCEISRPDHDRILDDAVESARWPRQAVH